MWGNEVPQIVVSAREVSLVRTQILYAWVLGTKVELSG